METGDPIEGVFPDCRKIIQSILATGVRPYGRYFTVKPLGRTGIKSAKDDTLPEIAFKAYDILL